jgi:hypothetical protein
MIIRITVGGAYITYRDVLNPLPAGFEGRYTNTGSDLSILLEEVDNIPLQRGDTIEPFEQIVDKFMSNRFNIPVSG